MLIVPQPPLLLVSRIAPGHTMVVEYDGSVPLLALRHGACRLITIGIWRAERAFFFPNTKTPLQRFVLGAHGETGRGARAPS